MKFLDLDPNLEPVERSEWFEEYRRYLLSIRQSLPKSTFEFAIANWHYDPADPRCPHDSWVESISLLETANDQGAENRSLSLSISLLGAYHDRHIILEYDQVYSYTLEKAEQKSGDGLDLVPYLDSHGDWLIDEIRLSERENVIHEIVFSTDSRWIIECSRITYDWKLISDTSEDADN